MNDWINEWTVDVGKTVIGLVGAAIGGSATYAWRRRRTSDRELFLMLRQALDRPAFRGEYILRSSPEAFAEAIGIVLKVVETGKYLDRKGNEIGQLPGQYRGPFSVRDTYHRKVLEDCSNHLQTILHLLSTATTEDEKIQIKDPIDFRRDALIDSLNGVWSSMGIAEMLKPTEFKTYADTQDPFE